MCQYCVRRVLVSWDPPLDEEKYLQAERVELRTCSRAVRLLSSLAAEERRGLVMFVVSVGLLVFLAACCPINEMADVGEVLYPKGGKKERHGRN